MHTFVSLSESGFTLKTSVLVPNKSVVMPCGGPVEDRHSNHGSVSTVTQRSSAVTFSSQWRHTVVFNKDSNQWPATQLYYCVDIITRYLQGARCVRARQCSVCLCIAVTNSDSIKCVNACTHVWAQTNKLQKRDNSWGRAPDVCCTLE